MKNKHLFYVMIILFSLIIQCQTITAREVLGPSPNLLLEIFEPGNIYEENGSSDELIITSSAWVNRAIDILSFRLHLNDAAYHFDPPLEMTENYDARQLEDGIFILYDYDQKPHKFQTTDEEDHITFSIQTDVSVHEKGSQEEYEHIGMIAMVLDPTIDLSLLYEAYTTALDNNEEDKFTVSDITISRDAREPDSVTIFRDLTDEVKDGQIENYAQNIPESQQSDEFPLITAEKINNYQLGEREKDQQAYHFVNEAMVAIFKDEDLDSEKQDALYGYDYSTLAMDIFSKDYKAITQPFVNREWVNRILNEYAIRDDTNFKYETALLLVGHGSESNTFYFYPRRSEEIYLYSGIYNGRHLVELRFNNYESKDIKRMIEREEKEEFHDALYEDFAFFASLLDYNLTDEEINDGFQRFYEDNSNFQLGNLTVYQDGLKENIIYFSRDITEEVEQGAIENYTESLADSSTEPLINEEVFQIGYPEYAFYPKSIRGEKMPYFEDIQFSFSFSNSYKSILENINTNYTELSLSIPLSGKILDIERKENGYLIALSHSKSGAYLYYEETEDFLLLIPPSHYDNTIEVGSELQARGRLKGYHKNLENKLLPIYYILPEDDFDYLNQ